MNSNVFLIWRHRSKQGLIINSSITNNHVCIIQSESLSSSSINTCRQMISKELHLNMCHFNFEKSTGATWIVNWYQRQGSNNITGHFMVIRCLHICQCTTNNQSTALYNACVLFHHLSLSWRKPKKWDDSVKHSKRASTHVIKLLARDR